MFLKHYEDAHLQIKRAEMITNGILKFKMKVKTGTLGDRYLSELLKVLGNTRLHEICTIIKNKP